MVEHRGNVLCADWCEMTALMLSHASLSVTGQIEPYLSFQPVDMRRIHTQHVLHFSSGSGNSNITITFMTDDGCI